MMIDWQRIKVDVGLKNGLGNRPYNNEPFSGVIKGSCCCFSSHAISIPIAIEINHIEP